MVCAGLLIWLRRTIATKLCDVFPATANAAVVGPPKNAGFVRCLVMQSDAGASEASAQLTPASLNRWTSPERWPPPGSDRSSGFS